MPATLDQVFATTRTSTEPPPPPHPKIQEWIVRMNAGAKAQVMVSLPEGVFGSSSTELTVRFTGDDGEVSEDTHNWEDELNEWLVSKGVRSTDEENEKTRFAIGLRAPMRAATRELGDGFFNSVLLEIVTDAKLTQHPEIQEMVAHSHAPKPSLTSRGYLACRQWIIDIFGRNKYRLQSDLKYTPDEGSRILVGALAHYLDERFSVSNRRRLGLL